MLQSTQTLPRFVGENWQIAMDELTPFVADSPVKVG